MAIDWAAVKRDDGGWNFSWSAGTAPYSIYLNGLLLATASSESYEFTLDGYKEAPPPLEIINTGDDAESLLYPCRAHIQWRGVSGAYAYIIQQYLNSSWRAIRTISESSAGYYGFTTKPLADIDTHLFRVVAVDELGNGGTPVQFSFFMARNPEPPTVDINYSSGNIEVSA